MRTWDITLIARDWYANNNNTGLMLRSSVEGNNTIAFAQILSTAYFGTGAIRPVMQIDYRNSTGIEGYWTYVSEDAGRNGTAHINVFNGNAIVSQPIVLSSGGNLLPVSLDLIYNSNNFSQLSRLSTVGYGWKTNYHIHVDPVDVDQNGEVDHYYYTDSDGTRHAFSSYNGGLDEDGLGYTLRLGDASNVFDYYVITDRDGNTLKFDDTGNLREIQDDTKNTIALTYSEPQPDKVRINTITDGAGRVYTFCYDSEDQDVITSIVDPANRVTSFIYESGRLTGIVFPDGKEVTMTYHSHNRLYTITGNDGGTTSITYDAIDLYRANDLTRAYDGQIESKVSFEYALNETKVADIRGRSITYQFDYYGQTTAVISHEEGAGVFYQYEDRVQSPLNAYKLSQKSSIQKAVVNLLKNPNFDSGDDHFTPIGSGASVRAFQWDGNKGNTATGSLKVSRTGIPSASNDYAFYSQYFTVPETGFYTLSGYANTAGETISSHGAEIRLERWSAGHGTYLDGAGVSINQTEVDEWKYGSVTLFFNKGDTIKCLVGIEDAVGIGTAWFDDLQLEYGEVGNVRNLLQNTDFSNGYVGWHAVGASYIIEPPILDGAPSVNVLQVSGAIDELRRVEQTVQVGNGNAGDVYSVGSWAKGSSISTDPEDGLSLTATVFGVRVDFLNGDTVIGSERIAFNRYVKSWQFVSGEVVAPADYTAVCVMLEYNFNLNTAQFSSPYLYRKNYGTTYTYDENGQLKTQIDQNKGESLYFYNDQFHLTKMQNASGSTYLCIRNDLQQITKAITTDGAGYELTYDEHGNQTGATLTPVPLADTLCDGKLYYLVKAHDLKSPYNTYHIAVPTAELTFDNRFKWRFVSQPDDTYKLYSYTDELYGASYSIHLDGIEEAFFNTQGDDMTGMANLRFVKQSDGSYVILTQASNYTMCITSATYEESEDVSYDALKQESYDPSKPTDNQKWYVFEADVAESAYIRSFVTYSDSGNFIKSTTDALDNTTQYCYNETNGLLNSVTDPKLNTTSYQYNENTGTLSSVTAGGQTVQYSYNNVDQISSITATNGTVYSFSYDVFGRTTSIFIDDEDEPIVLGTWEYDSLTGLLIKQTYENGTVYSYTYDNLDRPTSVYYNGQLWQTFYYNANGDISVVADLISKKVVRSVLDDAGRVVCENTYVYTGTSTEESDLIQKLLKCNNLKSQASYTYDENTSHITEEVFVTPIGNTSMQYTYGGMDNGKIPDVIYSVDGTNSLVNNKAEKVEYIYDELGRLATRITYLNVDNDLTKSTTYTYRAGGHGYGSTSTQPASISTDGVTYSYSYDESGNVIAVRKNNVLQESYEYDALNQLKKVTFADGTYYAYDYYDNGNLKQIVTGNASGVQEVLHTYAYDDEVWHDQLTALDGESISYDSLGNPLTYYDGATLSWTNGNLPATITRNENTVVFGYAADGTRTTKTVNGITTTYYYVGGKLYGELTGNNKLIYLYDETNVPYGYIYNDTTYYYEKNLQGDVIGIYHQNGNRIANYKYDVFGGIVSITNQYGEDVSELPRHQANLNPIRYRGYHYDTEIGMYWVSGRLYDPQIGRFINADFELKEGLFGTNLYIYSAGDPINLKESHSGLSASVVEQRKTLFFVPELASSDICFRYDVPAYFQGNVDLCWAYCKIMIEDYRAGRIRPEEEADNLAIAMAIDYHNASGIEDVEKWNKGIKPDSTKINAILESQLGGVLHLYHLLVEYGPVVAVYYLPNGNGHMVTVTGVNLTSGMVYTNNPNRMQTGTRGSQSYEEFIKHYTGPQNGYDSSRFVYVGTNIYW